MKINVYVKWLFPDSVEKGELEFVEQKPFDKGGEVMYWLGKVNDEVGDFRCFPSAIKNIKELVMTLGSDDVKWVGKRFSVVPTTDKKKLVFSLMN